MILLNPPGSVTGPGSFKYLKQMQKNLIIFDGSNFYHGAKKLAPDIHLTSFNYRKLVECITGNTDNKIQYCVGEIKRERDNPKSARMYAGQQALFYNLEKQNIAIKKGFMLKTEGTYHEKGVDVRIAIDILWGAFKNEYERCFIISSDTDIIPAIHDAMDLGKAVIYVGFETFMSRALKANCSDTFIITKDIMRRCAS